MSYRTEDKARAVLANAALSLSSFTQSAMNLAQMRSTFCMANSPRFFIVHPTTYFTSRANKRRGVRGRAYSLKWRAT